MTLAAPRLDDRHFQDIVDEAKKRIPYYCKEWTDHNVSDPGVTLIELFAWMTDIILYRLNQVPDRHYVKFMEMMGIRLQQPVPAQVPVTFWLSAPQETAVTLPAGTEVASTQTETERSIIFTTDADFQVHPPQLASVLSLSLTSDGQRKQFRSHNLRRLSAGFEGAETFSKVPQLDDALYFGFANDLSHHILGLEMAFDSAGGAGVDPTLPPYIWEASTGDGDQGWQACDVDMDTTKGMNVNGRVHLHLPAMQKLTLNKETLYWVRARVRKITPEEQQAGMRPYQTSPRMQRLAAATWGGATPATHAQKISGEYLGQSDGSPGQRFQLQASPILARTDDEYLLVKVEGEPPQIWQEVNDFANSDAFARHYMLDGITGELRFGPAVRQPDGTMKLYGAIPPRGSSLLFQQYRVGGGQEGNVQAGILNTLKTAIPYIARVNNRKPAWGGLDAETLEAAQMRAPALLRSRDRAVSETDFEFLARQALPAAIGRVKCLQPHPREDRINPGQVFVLVIPRVARPAGYLEPAWLELNEADVAALRTYLDERRLLTTRLDVRAPAYRYVAARVQLRPSPGANRAEVEAQVMDRLYRFLNPLTGGRDGQGWPFGRTLFVSDVYQCLQGMPNVDFIRNVELHTTTPGGTAQGAPVEAVDVVAHGVVASGRHEVLFI
ncbi:MAG: putative baseplate assembly protein [Anaerolineales bacterium]|nr:putative baseplate assembly protein [Anaerolineales bacterium]MCB8967241.1 putative baseplate assembly protein [Ardenticatenaceae bacterium]